MVFASEIYLWGTAGAPAFKGNLVISPLGSCYGLLKYNLSHIKKNTCAGLLFPPPSVDVAVGGVALRIVRPAALLPLPP